MKSTRPEEERDLTTLDDLLDAKTHEEECLLHPNGARKSGWRTLRDRVRTLLKVQEPLEPVNDVDAEKPEAVLCESQAQELLLQLTKMEEGLKTMRKQIEDAFPNLSLERSAPTEPPPAPKKAPWIKPWMTRYIFVMSLFWQLLNLLVIYLDRKFGGVGIQVSAGVMITFQVVHVLVVVILSIKLTKQILHNTVTITFLISSYLSIIVLFAGLYSLVYRLASDSFEGLLLPSDTDGDAQVAIVFAKCVYFSVTTMVTVGLGDIHPVSWYACLLVALQALMSVTYTSLIFAKGISTFIDNSKEKRKQKTLAKSIFASLARKMARRKLDMPSTSSSSTLSSFSL
jgi:hypothetical protein